MMLIFFMFFSSMKYIFPFKDRFLNDMFLKRSVIILPLPSGLP